MTTKNSAQAKEDQFKSEGESTLAMAEMDAIFCDPVAVRKNLEDAGLQAAKDEGIDPAHARTILDGILAQFDKDVAANTGPGVDEDAASDAA